MADDGVDPFREAGGAAVAHNVPLGPERAVALAAGLADGGPRSVADLGCGRAALLLDVLDAAPAARGVGIDVDEVALADARAAAAARGLADRVRIVAGDLRSEEGRAPAVGSDRVLCVGSSHALGGTGPMLGALASLVPPGARALVGEAVWTAVPDEWCRRTFGELTDVEGLVEWAEMEGFAAQDVDRSTREEWDAFEAAWVEGVEALGTPDALAFAARRQQEYERYRGVLGFAWLVIRRG